MFFGCIIILHRKRQLFLGGRTLRTKGLSAGYQVNLNKKPQLLERSYLTFYLSFFSWNSWSSAFGNSDGSTWLFLSNLRPCSNTEGWWHLLSIPGKYFQYVLDLHKWRLKDLTEKFIANLTILCFLHNLVKSRNSAKNKK